MWVKKQRHEIALAAELTVMLGPEGLSPSLFLQTAELAWARVSSHLEHRG